MSDEWVYTEEKAAAPRSVTRRKEAPRPECWVFLSEQLPLPLHGKHRCVGSADSVASHIDAAGGSGEMVSLTLLVGPDKDVDVWLNPVHIVAVMP